MSDPAVFSTLTCAGRQSVTGNDGELTKILSRTRAFSQDKTTLRTNNVLSRWFFEGRKGWRRIVQNFTPSWFAAVMATGIISTIFHELENIYPRYEPLLRTLGIVFFIMNVVLFSVLCLVTLLRYALYPSAWGLMIRHPVQSLFLGSFPMGLATIVNMFVHVCVPAWGGSTPYIAWGLWWFGAAVSIVCCIGLPFQMMTKHEHRHENMTAAWLLPSAAPIVAAASGGTVASVLPNPNHALWTIITSYVLWGTAVPMALLVLGIYFHRLAIHGLPPRAVIVSVFIPLGPLGQAGFSVMTIGKAALHIFPKTHSLHPLAGEMLYVLSFIVALIFWGFGLVWGCFAVASIARSRFPFTMGWWGTVFPTGIYAMSTITLGIQLPSAFFKILGTVFGIAVMLVWLFVTILTIMRAFSGTMFRTPQLDESEKARKMAIDEELPKEPA